MKYLVFVMPLALALTAAAPHAMPVDPSSPDGVAAFNGQSALGTNGEYWACTDGNWSRPFDGLIDPPFPLESIEDWRVTTLMLKSGDWMYFNFIQGEWLPIPPPPFAAIPRDEASVGSVKSLFR